MPSLDRDGASIFYEEFGQEFPTLTFAPAGLQSVIDVWSRPSAPLNPTTKLAAHFRVIAMDQRNAGGRSRAPITAQDGWHTYAADHVALLDHWGSWSFRERRLAPGGAAVWNPGQREHRLGGEHCRLDVTRQAHGAKVPRTG